MKDSRKELLSHDDKVRAAIELLGDKRSPQRRSGAKRLRKLKDSSAGSALFAALQKEVQDPRTWETQYHMIMALGECSYVSALPYLQELARRSFEATMVYVALGDSIVRLDREHADDPTPILELMNTGNDMLVDGAFRAMAMLQLKLNERAVEGIIKYVTQRNLNDGLRFWVAAAAAGWDGPEVSKFLRECAEGIRDDVKWAATAALNKKYLKWNPL